MSGHTPGTWRARGAVVFGPDIDGDPYLVAGSNAFVGAHYSPKRDEAEANARLIAAAPELKTFAVALDNFWTVEFPGGPDAPIDANGNIVLSDDTIELWRQCRAAIAKAEGRS